MNKKQSYDYCRSEFNALVLHGQEKGKRTTITDDPIRNGVSYTLV